MTTNFERMVKEISEKEIENLKRERVILPLDDYLDDDMFAIPDGIFIEINYKTIQAKSKDKLYLEWDIKNKITEKILNSIIGLIYSINYQRTILVANVDGDNIERKIQKSDVKRAILHTTLFQDLKNGREKFKSIIKEEYQVSRDNNIKFTGILKMDNFSSNVELFWERQPFFYDKSGIYWIWDLEKKCWNIIDEVDVINIIDDELNFGGQIVTSVLRKNYLNAFKQIGRKKMPKEAPKSWVQFKDKIFDIRTGDIIKSDPSFFLCNPIPHELGKSTETPVMDKLFKDWVGDKFVPTIYELLAYCCLTDYPIHLIFCFVGSGRNGKSQLQKIIRRFLGTANICSTELDLLVDNRFESSKLYKKLVCSLGETNFGVLKKTSMLKKLSGGDLIGYEFKNKMPFDDNNYAKIIINSNSLPTSLDTSDGFYRRWFIINFLNEFPEGKEIVNTIPEEEYNNLALKITKILPQLLEEGVFSNQGSIEERRKAYIMASNPFPFFLENFCERDVNAFTTKEKLSGAYKTFLIHNKKRTISAKEFNESLLAEGFSIHRTFKQIAGFGNSVRDNYIDGLSLKSNWKELLSSLSLLSTNSQLGAITKKLSEKHKDNVDKLDNPVDLSLTDGNLKQDILFLVNKVGELEIDFIKDHFKVSENLVTSLISDGDLFQVRPRVVRASVGG